MEVKTITIRNQLSGVSHTFNVPDESVKMYRLFQAFEKLTNTAEKYARYVDGDVRLDRAAAYSTYDFEPNHVIDIETEAEGGAAA